MLRNRYGLLFSVIFCFELFGNPSATPLFVRKLVDQPGGQHGNQNWALENRRRIASRRGKRPATKAAQIWALWPDIRIAIAEGERIGVIRDWLEEDAGIKLSTACLTTYIYRCRRKELRAKSLVPSGLAAPLSQLEPEASDPMAGAREALNKPRFDIRKLHGDGDPTGRKLI